MKRDLCILTIILLIQLSSTVFSQTGLQNNIFPIFNPIIIDSSICFSPKDGKQIFIYLEERNYFKELNNIKDQQLNVKSQIINFQTSIIKNDSIKHLTSYQLYTDQKHKTNILLNENAKLNKNINFKNKIIIILSTSLASSIVYILIKR